MFGYGPRYLHSTGQLHKGGANNGVFIIITAEPQRICRSRTSRFRSVCWRWRRRWATSSRSIGPAAARCTCTSPRRESAVSKVACTRGAAEARAGRLKSPPYVLSLTRSDDGGDVVGGAAGDRRRTSVCGNVFDRRADCSSSIAEQLVRHDAVQAVAAQQQRVARPNGTLRLRLEVGRSPTTFVSTWRIGCAPMSCVCSPSPSSISASHESSGELRAGGRRATGRCGCRRRS